MASKEIIPVAGQRIYRHRRMSNDGGNTFTGNNGDDEGLWHGEYWDFTKEDSEKTHMYHFKKLIYPMSLHPEEE